MKTHDYLWLGLLLIIAAFIWLRDLAWVTAASETVPILIAFPLFVWLGWPWRFQGSQFQLHQGTLAVSGILLAVGLAVNLTFLLAMAWTLALWSWLRSRVIADTLYMRRLVLLPLMAFPWLALDMEPIGWWFRITATWVAHHVFGGLGFVVLRQGTNLLVHGLPIEVAPACSGMNSLQSVLIAGTVLALHALRASRWFWLSLVILPVLVWGANVLRICSAVAIALSWGVGFARGWFHEAAGWLVVMVVFIGWWFVIQSLLKWPVARGRST